MPILSFLLSIFGKRNYLLIGVLVLFFFQAADYRAWSADEYRVKAAFVFNFIKFTQWPESHFETQSSPIRLCYIGNGKGAGQFAGLNGKKIGKRGIEVHLDNPSQCCKTCDIIFISRSIPGDQVSRLLSQTRQAAILSIGETRGFAGHGGVINFFFNNDKLQFEINPGAAREKGIKLSSRLLKLAVIVE